MAFFEKIQLFRMRTRDIEMIDEIVKNNPIRYANKSHFFRVAVIAHMRKEHNKLSEVEQ